MILNVTTIGSSSFTDSREVLFHASFNDTNRTDINDNNNDVADDEDTTGKVVRQFVKYFPLFLSLRYLSSLPD